MDFPESRQVRKLLSWLLIFHILSCIDFLNNYFEPFFPLQINLNISV